MLSVRGLSVSFASEVLRGVDLDVHRGEVMCLLGPSGCGKTTLLRVIAGLEAHQAGRVCVEERDMSGVPIHERGFGLMFQDFALFPHMNVAKNIMFGLRMRGMPRDAQRQRMTDMLNLVGLAGFEGRDVAQLSGGEKQRVALARSLAPNPRLLMLDEPLGALDAGLRERLVVELRQIIKEIGLTAIYVTHDQQEAFAIADQVAVMNLGRIEQVDTPEALYRRPATRFVAEFIGFTNIIPVRAYHDDLAHTDIGAFTLPTKPGTPPGAVLIHPDGVILSQDDEISEAAALSGKVVECVFQGGAYRVRVWVENTEVLFTFYLPHKNSQRVRVGQPVRLHYDPQQVVWLA